MPRLTLIYPAIGHAAGRRRRYVRSWQMQPLAIAALAALTPSAWTIRFYDDRVERVVDDEPADLVGISIETFTARRGYELAKRFRARGVPVVLGGYHATLCPDEAQAHADAVCVGEAEPVWGRILADAAAGRLQRRYAAPARNPLSGLRYDRSVFKGKPYFSIGLVETSRGCPHACEFCSVTAFHRGVHRRRPVAEVIDELRALPARTVFFVDDNIVADGARAREWFQALRPLRRRWVSQASVTGLRDPRMVAAMRDSGCVGLLIGFESLAPDTLARMGKPAFPVAAYRETLATLRRAGIVVYGTFMFGYPGETAALMQASVNFAQEERLFLAAFNHVVPFPGTPLHARLLKEGRLPDAAWWLSAHYRFGNVPFKPHDRDAAALEQCCHEARRAFYAPGSILRRGGDLRANCRSPGRAMTFLSLNLLLHREITQKRGLPLGDGGADTAGPGEAGYG